MFDILDIILIVYSAKMPGKNNNLITRKYLQKLPHALVRVEV